MSLILNIAWFIFGGFLLALGWLVAAVFMAITVIGLPWARSALVIARMAAAPFGVEAIDREMLTGRSDIGTGALGLIGNVLWFALAGLWLGLGHLIAAILSGLTIIGIPFAVAHLKLANVSLLPVGKTIVSKAVAEEARRRAAVETIDGLRSGNRSSLSRNLPTIAIGGVLGIFLLWVIVAATSSSHPKLSTVAISTPPMQVTDISGKAEVLDTATLVIQGKTLHLAGIEGQSGPLANQLKDFLVQQGLTVNCSPTGARYACRTASGVDVAEAILYNGAGKAGSDASARLLGLQQEAKANRRGLWGG